MAGNLRPFELERYFAKYEFNTRFLMCSSDIETLSVRELLALDEAEGNAGGMDALLDTSLGYTESAGLPELREDVAGLYSACGAQDVLLHAGAEEAIFAFARVLAAGRTAEQGPAHFVVHWPCYQSLFEVARSEGAEVSPWSTSHEQGWELDLDALRGMLTSNTVAVIVNCPHNPTGYLMSREKQAALVELCREHDLYLFSDEVYRLTEQDPAASLLPAAADLYEKAVSLGVMSKCYGMAGLRVGWAATRDRWMFDALAAHKDFVSICCSAPSETLSRIALRVGERVLERNRELLGRNLLLMKAFLEERAHLFECVLPVAGTTCFPRIKAEVGVDADAFAQQLLEAKQVLILPGSQYAPEFAQHFRFSFARADMAEALEQMRQFTDEAYPSPSRPSS